MQKPAFYVKGKCGNIQSRVYLSSLHHSQQYFIVITLTRYNNVVKLIFLHVQKEKEFTNMSTIEQDNENQTTATVSLHS